MSDKSFDSDSEVEDEDPVPRTSYGSSHHHSNAHQPHGLPESWRSSGADAAPRQFQNQARVSNFPPNFDQRYNAMNFVAMMGAQQKVKPEKSKPNMQAEAESGPRYHAQFQQQNQQQFPNFGYNMGPLNPSSNYSEVSDHKLMHTYVSHEQGNFSSGKTKVPVDSPLSYHTARHSHYSSPELHQTYSGGVRDFNGRSNFDENRRSYQPGILNYSSNMDSQHSALSAKPVSFNKLNEWSSFQNDTLLVFDMARHVDGLARLLRQDSMKFDWVFHLLLALKKIISIESQKGSLNYIFKCICESKFLEVHLPGFLTEIQQQKSFPDSYGCLQKTVDVLEFVMKNLKAFAIYCKKSLETLLGVGKSLNILTPGKDLTERVQYLLNLTVTKIRDIETRSYPATGHHTQQKAIPMPDDEEPEDDYKKMNIFPDTEELNTSVEPFLRANKTKGAYRNRQHYLDIHSRLMKEDYLYPIRNGLKNFKTASQSNTNPKEDDLRFYYNVKIVKIAFESDQGITHIVSFDNSPFHNVDWEHSKRLMFGSLLVFSKDHFESTIFATVAKRDEENLRRGRLEVVFQNNLERVFTSSENDIFIMAETTAYFESYRHVLEGLKEMEAIPLDRYIISCSRDLYSPRYLQQDLCYDVSSIMQKDYDCYPVPILDYSKWPDGSGTILNESQLKALKLALTKEVAVIQGPPGTGKTYVGLKIMRILLENKVMKNAVGSKGPILVVCYTNHALDQFLEGILDFCKTGIVRVGGRSSSELLEEFNLKKLRQNPYLSKRMRVGINQRISFCRKQLKVVSKTIERFWQETLRLETTILSMQDLDEEITKKQKISLNDPRRCSSIPVHIISTWLKASNANMDRHLNSCARRHLGKVAYRCEDVQNDSDLKNRKQASKVDFKTRVKIYNFWVKRYEAFINEELQKLLSGDPKNELQIGVLMEAQDEIKNDILSDKILKPYMGEKVYEAIKACVKFENNSEVEDSTYIRHWLLDCLKKTDQILDAIEQLTVTKVGVKRPHNRGKIFAETEASLHEDRWVIDDSDESEAGSDASDDESDDERNIDMEGLDNEGEVKMSDVHELEHSYQQFQNKEVVMLQRAKFLGVDLTETQEEDEGWQTANTMSYSKVFHLYHSVQPFTDEEASDITDVWSLSLSNRYRLYKYWIQARKNKLTQRLIDLTKEYKDVLRCKKEALSVKDVAILKRSTVIGVTTTGAAKLRAVLQEVGCHIIVVEEAAEVLEAHIVTTLNSNCQHLILIGDHQQLRPSPTVHRLAVDYELEISLFERLIKNGIPHVTLTEQHRMRPEISTFLRHIYPKLQDHYSVLRYESIRGVRSNVFFIDHSYKESSVEDTMSKANIHEAKFITGLCKYFFHHEYQSNQITVLAAYSGQVKAIRDEMEIDPIFEKVRVTSIDNYQGEENDIILLSLVRSNETGEVGFLKTSNRICVALSRAKKGLYVIGNFQMLATRSELWKKMVSTAQSIHVLGVGLQLVCVNHQHITYIVNPEDFEKEVPEGGCNKRCEAELPCGHTCRRMCHASDILHESVKCTQPCLKQCPKGHPCQKDCYQACGDCEVRVTKRIPLCGHDDQVPCYLDVDDAVCSQNCHKIMQCGHTCRGQCGVCKQQGYHQPCLAKVDKDWSCGHRNNVECQTDVTTEPCPTRCDDRLECKHKCKGTCGGCLSGRVHRACTEKCKQPLPCGHLCEGLCGVMCSPCKLRCPSLCRHGICSKLSCGDLCEPCREDCAMTCQHRQCSALCKDTCVAPPCDRRCGKPTPCKHKCWSLCGEICVCYQCEKDKFCLIDYSNKKKPQYVVKHEKEERAKKFEIGKDDILMKIPKCKHIFTLKQLDRYIDSVDPTTTSFIRCPVCTSPIQGISRYEAQNQQRAERRENRKEEIIQNSKVSDNKIRRIKESKYVVEHFCTVDEGEFLSRKPELIDSNHALALTMQMRFAFALYKINDIHKEFNQDVELRIRKWKMIVSLIQQSMPPQLLKEMTMEIYRLLFMEQFRFLDKVVKTLNIVLEDELKTSLRAVGKDLSKQQKLTVEDKKRYQCTLDSLYKKCHSHDLSEEWATEIETLQDKVSSATRVLDHSHTEDLITILRHNDQQELDATILESESDSDDAEEY